MKKEVLITLFAPLVFCCCHRVSKGSAGAVFSPGQTSGYILNTEIYNSVKEVDKLYKVTSSDYAFLCNCLTKSREEVKQRAISPYIFISLDSVLYVLGHNRVVLTEHRAFLISQSEEYRIKSMFHYYDYQDDCFLPEMEEIKRFGVPNNRQFMATDPKKPIKLFVKVIIQEQ